MKLYHFDHEGGFSAPDGSGPEAIRGFLVESLKDYLTVCGRDLPEPLERGAFPAMRKGPHGKPYFEEPGLEGVFFSLSHTRGHAIVCFSEGEIGADCENTEARGEARLRYKRIADRCFSEDEKGYADLGAPDGALRFFEIWTAKEAYMKYTGNGFSEGMRSFSVLDAQDVCIETGRLQAAQHVVFSVCTAAGGEGLDGERRL